MLKAQHENDTTFDRLLGLYTGGEQRLVEYKLPEQVRIEEVKPDAVLDANDRAAIKQALAASEVEKVEGYGEACTWALVETKAGLVEIISEIAGMGSAGPLTIRPAKQDSAAAQNLTTRILGLYDPTERTFVWDARVHDNPEQLASQEAVEIGKQLLEKDTHDSRRVAVLESGRAVAVTEYEKVVETTLKGVPVRITRVGGGIFNEIKSIIIDKRSTK